MRLCVLKATALFQFRHFFHFWNLDLLLTVGVAGELRPRARGSRGQCDHQRMVAHVARHGTKTRFKLREFLFFCAQDVYFALLERSV